MSDGEGEKRDAFRPRVGGRGGEVPQERAPRFRNGLLARIARIGAQSRVGASRPRGTASARDVPRPGPGARRCVIKSRFVPMNAYGKRAAALHLSYVERDGVEADGGEGRLYGPAEVSDPRARLDGQVEGEKRQFRFIVSPEDGAEVDLTAFTRRLMAQVQADLGRVLVWGAVNHWNTDNPHVHVIVRGVDEDGRDVTIDGRYLSEGMRSRAQTILTNELGPRTQHEIQDQLAREVRQERFTSLDRTLQAKQEPDCTLVKTSLAGGGQVAGARLMARLGRLEQLGLVTRASPVEWRFRDGWAEALRELGQTNDIVKRMHAAAPVPDPSSFVIVHETTPLPAVEGVVRSKGLHDELSGRPFAIVEALDGRIFYAPIDVATAEKIAEGQIVRLAVEAPPRPALDAAMPREGSRARIRVQVVAPPLRSQVSYRGPTWLDKVSASPSPGPTGAFGREVADCLVRRDAGVTSLGIDTKDPEARMRALVALEAKTLAARLAAERGLTLAESPSAMSGTLSLAPPLPSGRQYALIVDEASRRLWVLPANKGLRLLDGHRVQGRLDAEGRLMVSEAAPGRTPRGPER